MQNNNKSGLSKHRTLQNRDPSDNDLQMIRKESLFKLQNKIRDMRYGIVNIMWTIVNIISLNV